MAELNKSWILRQRPVGDLKEGEKMTDTSEFFIKACSKSNVSHPQRLGNKAHKWLHVWNPALPADPTESAPAPA